MEYSNAFVVCGEDSMDLSLLCLRHYGSVRGNVGMQGDTGRGVVIRGRIGMCLFCFTYTPTSEDHRLYQRSGALGISQVPYTTRTMVWPVMKPRSPPDTAPGGAYLTLISFPSPSQSDPKKNCFLTLSNLAYHRKPC